MAAVARRVSARKRALDAVKLELELDTNRIKTESAQEAKKVKHELSAKVEEGRAQVKEPENWRQLYEHVRKMRARIPAPVDTMGCERLPEGVSSKITPQVSRFQLLIALMLSAQTKDEVNAVAMATLRRELTPKGGLTVQAVRDTDEKDIDKMICKVGFHNRKARYIKQAVEILHDKYNDDIPSTIDEMISLPGVGPKMAHLLMQGAWGRSEGIGVDVHVHRLSNMWKWVPKSCQDSPEKTRIALEQWLPKEYWREINPTLVGFGQTVCASRVRKCELCDLAGTGLCKNVDRKRLRKYGATIKTEHGVGDIEDLV